jgi:hypothetical protein
MKKKETIPEMIIRKLTSRKLWMSICAFVVLIMTARGFTEAEAAQMSAIIMAGAVVLGYVLAEGLTDSAHMDEDEETTETHAYGFSMDDDE